MLSVSIASMGTDEVCWSRLLYFSEWDRLVESKRIMIDIPVKRVNRSIKDYCDDSQC